MITVKVSFYWRDLKTLDFDYSLTDYFLRWTLDEGLPRQWNWMSMMFYKEEFLCVCPICVNANCHGGGMEKHRQCITVAELLKWWLRFSGCSWSYSVALGTSGSSEQNVKTCGFKTSYIQSCFSLLQNHQRLFMFYHFTFSFVFLFVCFYRHHYMSLNLINFPFAFFVQTQSKAKVAFRVLQHG